MGLIGEWMVDSIRDDIAGWRGKVAVLLADRAAGRKVSEEAIRDYLMHIERAERRIESHYRLEQVSAARREHEERIAREKRQAAREESQRLARESAVRRILDRQQESLEDGERQRQSLRGQSDSVAQLPRPAPTSPGLAPETPAGSGPSLVRRLLNASTPAPAPAPSTASVAADSVPWCLDRDTASIVKAMLHAGRSKSAVSVRLAERGWPAARAAEAIQVVDSAVAGDPDHHSSIYARFGAVPSNSAQLIALSSGGRSAAQVTDLLCQHHKGWQAIERTQIEALVRQVCKTQSTSAPKAGPVAQATVATWSAPRCMNMETAEIVAAMLAFGKSRADIVSRLADRGWPSDAATAAIVTVERDLGTRIAESYTGPMQVYQCWPSDPAAVWQLQAAGVGDEDIARRLSCSEGTGWNAIAPQRLLELVRYLRGLRR